MNWMFIVDIAFFAILGLFTFPLIVLIVALLGGHTFDDARKKVKSFLANWGEVASKDFLDKLLSAAGITTTLFLLGFVAYTANRIGDAALPHSSSLFAYFRSAEVRWSVQSEGEWDEVKRQFRDVTGIGPDRLKWEHAKAEMGKYDVRFFRTIAVMFFFLAIIAVAALARRALRCRSLMVTGVALLALILSHWLWVERQEQYIENVLSRYVSEYMKQNNNQPPQRPASYPGWWPEAKDQ